MDREKLTIGVFIDLKKAFSTLNRIIFFYKLDHYGVRGVAKQWLISYLGNMMYVSMVCTSVILLYLWCTIRVNSRAKSVYYVR